MRRSVSVLMVIGMVLGLIAVPVLADRGGNGKSNGIGRGGIVRTQTPDGDASRENRGRHRATRTPTATGTLTTTPSTSAPTAATSTRTPSPRRTPVSKAFSARGYFVQWVGGTVLVLEDAWANNAASPAIDANGRLSVIVDADTRYHVYGEGEGYTTGLPSETIPVGARVQVQGTTQYPLTASGARSQVPLLFADKVIVDLEMGEAEDPEERSSSNQDGRSAGRHINAAGDSVDDED